MAEAPDEWITAPQAARRLGLTLSTIYNLINAGALPADVTIWTDRPRPRRSIRLRASDVETYLGYVRLAPGEAPDAPGDSLPLKSTGEEWEGAPRAAKRLGLRLTTLYRIIDAGGLPAYKFGRVIRLRTADIDAFIEQVRVQPGELAHLYDSHAEPVGRRG